MNRTEFMDQLGVLLQDISPGEREEALQYYNDYFDDAGAENEQKVLEALGNPARVAENIRRELLENQAAKDATAADRALVEYGKAASEDGEGDMAAAAADAETSRAVPVTVWGTGNSRRAEDNGGATAWSQPGSTGTGSGAAWSQPGSTGTGSGAWSQPGSTGPGGATAWSQPGSTGTGSGTGRNQQGGNRSRSAGMSGGMIALIIALAVFASPFIVGLLCIVLGLLITWFAIIFSFGAVALSLFIVLILLIAVGVMCIPVDPLAGAGVIGGGLVCGALGLLFLMLTVLLAGTVTPAIFKGISWMFRAGWKRKE